MGVLSEALTGDRRVELAILGQRQRNRYLQCKRLKLKIPANYAKVRSIRLLPKFIQEELLKYPEAVEQDSSYEEDQNVLASFKQNPISYILGSDLQKKEQLEQSGQPYRILNARKKKGVLDIKADLDKLVKKAATESLDQAGIVFGMNNNLKNTDNSDSEPKADSDDTRRRYERKFIDKFAQYLSKNPQIFTEEPKCIHIFNQQIQSEYAYLLKFPALVVAYGEGCSKHGK